MKPHPSRRRFLKLLSLSTPGLHRNTSDIVPEAVSDLENTNQDRDVNVGHEIHIIDGYSSPVPWYKRVSAPLIDDGCAYLADSSAVRAVDLDGPTELWNYNLEGRTEEGGQERFPLPVIDEERVYFAESSCEIVALDRLSGEVKLEREADYELGNLMEIEDGVLVTSNSHPIHALDTSDGSLLWKRDHLPNWWGSEPPELHDGIVYHPTSENGLCAVDARSGEELWSTPLVEEGTSGISFYADGRIYHSLRTSDSDYLTCVSAHTGEKVWRREVDYSWDVPHNHIPPTHNEGVLYIAEESHPRYESSLVYAVDSENGDLLWRREFPDENRVHSSPAVHEDTIYVGTDNQAVHALDAHDGSVIWSKTDTLDEYPAPAVEDGNLYFGDAYNLYRANLPVTDLEHDFGCLVPDWRQENSQTKSGA